MIKWRYGSILLTRHCGGDSLGPALFKIENADPFRVNCDAGHLSEHTAYLIHPALPRFLAEVSLCRERVFRHHTVNKLDGGAAPDQQHFVWSVNGIDGQGYLRICFKYL